MINDRIDEIRAALDNRSALLVTSDSNRFYLTGFKSSAGIVLITKEKAYFLIDFRYIEKAKSVVGSCEVILMQRLDEQLSDLCNQHKVRTMYVETSDMSLSSLQRYRKMLPKVKILEDSKFDLLIEEMRSIKTKDELSFIMQAQKLTDKTFSYILERIEIGRTEREIMLDMEFYIRKLGSEGVSFDFIVVSGKNSALPHGVPTDKPIEKGDFITMDFGAVVNGYRSDMTRTVAVGDVTDEQRAVYNTVLKAQQLALGAIKAGEVCKDIDKLARDFIYQSGYERCFGHGLGHSVGIDIHENPNFNLSCGKILQTGNIMTVEPGIYLENQFGVRIEDMVCVEENGCLNLTHSPKELIIL